MSDSGRRRDEPELFDLPLENPPREESSPSPDDSERQRSRQRASAKDKDEEALPLFAELEEEEAPRALEEPSAPPTSRGPAPDEGPGPPAAEAVPSPVPAPAEPSHAGGEGSGMPWRPARLATRWAAAGWDLLAHAGVLVIAGLATWWMGVAPGPDQLLPLGLFLLVFSFFYAVIPLAFWGQTPGMVRTEIVARNGTEPLTFGQTALRWLGGVVTVVLLGLPSFLALASGRSLTDRLSGSQTYEIPA